jgi:hypothetical protein
MCDYAYNKRTDPDLLTAFRSFCDVDGRYLNARKTTEL